MASEEYSSHSMSYLGDGLRENLTVTLASMGLGGRKKRLRGLMNWNNLQRWEDKVPNLPFGSPADSRSSAADSTRRGIWWEGYSSTEDSEDRINWPPFPSHTSWASFNVMSLRSLGRRGRSWWLECWQVYKTFVLQTRLSFHWRWLTILHGAYISLPDQEWGK